MTRTPKPRRRYKRRYVVTSALPAKYAPGFLDVVDRRTRAAQLVTTTMEMLAGAKGGWDEVTPQERMLIERASWAHRRLQEIEAQYSAGQGLDATEWSVLTGSLTRCLSMLGLGRRAKAADFRSYIQSKSSARPATEPSAQASLLPSAPPDTPVGCEGGEA